MYYFLKTLATPLVYLLFYPKISGKEYLQLQEGSIIIANHVSFLDAIILGVIFRRKVHFMAKKEVFRKKWAIWLLTQLGVYPVNRGTADVKSIKHSFKLLKENKVIGIFPEGTRSKSGQLGEFNQGAAAIAYRTKAKIVLVGIKSKWKIFRSTTVSINLGEKVMVYYQQPKSPETIKEMTNVMKQEIYRMIG